ncbi:hypothetical protein GCM10023331_20080 [Algivirga pacifica]|uniref:Uncharacterized protein n=1 Tax=Algivirga pacifica TaxID=1162670 RepID=A0ABP9DC24_9BACT
MYSILKALFNFNFFRTSLSKNERIKRDDKKCGYRSSFEKSLWSKVIIKCLNIMPFDVC